MRIALQPAFVLHLRPYRETSVLLDLLTEEHGRIGVIARGVRQQRSRLKSLLQPFIPLLVACQGRGELMTLVSAESYGQPLHLQGECLLSGLYLNELLVKVLHKHDPHPELYTIYQHTLLELQGAELRQKTLRLFEKKLLDELGYGVPFTVDGNPFQEDKLYRFHPERGFLLYHEEDNDPAVWVFSGKSLLAFESEHLDEADTLRDAKRLMRLAMAPLLGQYQLNSRKLFIKNEKVEVEIS